MSYALNNLHRLYQHGKFSTKHSHRILPMKYETGFGVFCLGHIIVCSVFTWASYQIRKIVGCACAGNAGNVFPRRRAVMHVGIAHLRWRGKRSRHSRRMRDPQFYVSGKRPMMYVPISFWVVLLTGTGAIIWLSQCLKSNPEGFGYTNHRQTATNRNPTQSFRSHYTDPFLTEHLDGLVQDSSNSNALAMELLKSYTKLLILASVKTFDEMLRDFQCKRTLKRNSANFSARRSQSGGIPSTWLLR